MATSLRKTVSAEIGSFLLNNGFALADNSKNRIFQEELVSIANSLSDYYEEGAHLYPEVLLTNNIANIPFFMIFVFFEGQLEQKSLSRAIKMCAPLCNDGWSIFLEVNNDGIRWGMVNSEQKITSLSLLNSVTLFADKEHTFALMHNIGAKTVEIVPANGNESYIVSLSLGEVDAVQNLHLNSLCEVVGEKCEDKLFCDFMEKIVQIFEQMHIPFNYWTASLFLWILEKTDEANIHNNFELVQLYIDELLHRKGIVKYNELNIQYDDLLSYLGCLAERLLSEYNDDYSMSYAQWANFTEEHIAKHQKYTENVENTLSTLLRIGVMYKTPHERYTFRLKGVFEYFLAYQMSKNEAFKQKVIEQEHFYLSFGNEFELYSGFKKDDFEFPRFIFGKTKQIFSPLTALPDYNAIDDRLKNDVMSISKLMSSVNKLITKIENLVETDDDYCPMSTQHLIETSKVEKKKYYDKIDPTTENVEKALFILARVYRNSNICDCTEDKTADDILDFLLAGTCNLGLMFMNNFEDKANLDDLQAQDLIKIVMQYMPLMVEAFLYDAVAQKNLSRIFEEKLKELKMNPHGNSFKIFLLTFVLVDLDINKYYNLIDDLIQYIGKGILRYATYGKLCVLCFKNNSNSALSESLIQKAKFLGSQFIEGNVEEVLRKNISDKSLKEKNEIRLRNVDY